ncbi:RHS repeat protein [Runella aurantiaca]|uniref:DUF4595 domain-containing protein n=1 Tax=Runella aurantiaca TaxID=2282308 RepID=A0A369IAA9_9BACT|nr:RHS repeat protein [Runella aurantiaca]RDB05962.1 hypothetical protein DVG78_11180 [Runella aurantiaca]
MKTLNYFFAIIQVLAILSCQKNEAPTPNSTSTKVCQLSNFTDLMGNEIKINSFDNEGRVLSARFKQTQGQILTQTTTFVYEANGQLKSGNQTYVDEKGTQLASQPLIFTYENGLLTKIEVRCGCAKNEVSQITTLKYNANKQLIEKTNESPDAVGKITFAYEYDAKGNVSKEKVSAGTLIMAETDYTYDDAKHPFQLLKGISLNFFENYSPWKINVPLTLKGYFMDENGQKQSFESKRTDLKTNAKGYAAAITYDGAFSEAFSFTDCD